MLAQSPVTYNYYAKLSHFTLKIMLPNIYNLFIPSKEMSQFSMTLVDV